MRAFQKLRPRLLAAAVVLAAAGCGVPRTDVTGTVTHKGRPVVYGTVSVIGSDQATYYRLIQPDGTFAVAGVPAGPARVGVYSPDPYFDPPIPAAEKAKADEFRRTSGAPLPAKPPKGKWFRLPVKYADPVSSGLTANLAPEKAELVLRLE